MVNNVTKLWDDCLAIIKDNLPAEQFNAWFSPIVAISFEDNKLILKVPTQFFIDYIEETYPALLTYTLKRVFGDKVRLAYKYDVVSNVPDTEVTIKNDNISARLKTNLATQPT